MIFPWSKNIATEAQGEGDSSELSLVRDARGNWVNEATGEIYSSVVEPEDDDDADS